VQDYDTLQAARSWKLEKLNILIIEDDLDMSKSLEDILRLRGYEPCAAGNGAEGLALLKKKRFDIVLIDLSLPDIFGVKVMSQVKAALRFAELIVITGNTSLDSAVECMKKGASDYLTKPLDCAKLFASIDSAVANIKRCGVYKGL
jgi:DNA-binding NtrC family response regulator